MSQLTPAQKVAAYIKLRDHKKAAEESFKDSLKRVVEAMAKLEAELLQHLIDTGASSLAADGVGTVYRNTRVSATVEDRAAFRKFCQQHDEAMDLKANVTFVKEFMEEHGQPVPGIKVTQMHTVGVRRS